jgi:hypothetical protein
MKKRYADLTPRDRQLLEMIARYRLGMDDLFRLGFSPMCKAPGQFEKSPADWSSENISGSIPSLRMSSTTFSPLVVRERSE